MKTSIIIPTMGRPTPQQVPSCIRDAWKTTEGFDREIVVVVERNWSVVESLPQDLPLKVIWRQEGRGPIIGWNEGATYAEGDLFVLGADDVVWNPGWLEVSLSALSTLPNQCGVVGFNDLHRTEADFATHFAASRKFCIDVLGGVFVPPIYSNYFVDVEIWARARQLKCYTFAKDAIVEHKHFFYDHDRFDSVYQLGQQHYDADEAIFKDRAKRRFPNEWESILKSEVIQ